MARRASPAVDTSAMSASALHDSGDQSEGRDGGSSYAWDRDTVESSAVAAELENLDAEIQRELGDLEPTGENEDSNNYQATSDSTAVDPGPYEGNVETRLLQAEAELRNIKAKIGESNEALREVQAAAEVASEKAHASQLELQHVVGVIAEVYMALVCPASRRANHISLVGLACASVGAAENY